jgi:translation initiation factor 2B subunit (eIF-2B alpha/beta/delta family)/ADP-ribose pyrophosphatase YjhB (NUDIX family)
MADDGEATEVVTVFLRDGADVLLFRRSDAVGSDSGQWGAVAGHAEGDPGAAAREEIREEAGLDPEADVTLVRRGDPFDVVDDDLGTRWLVHPYLFDARTREVTTNDETTEHEWLPPTEILRCETVPELWTSYDRVRPTVETVAADHEHGSSSLSLRALELLRDEAALGVERGTTDWAALVATARGLRDARPSMVVIANRVNRAMADAAGEGTPAAVERAATAEIDRALAADERAAARAAERLPGRVATLSRSGTVLSALAEANPETVLVAESRPGREGVDTAERIESETDAAVTVTTDAAFGELLAEHEAGALLVGADAVLPDGRVVNKVGTRGAVAAADAEGAERYVVTTSDKVRPAEGGETAFDPEERDPSTVYDGEGDVSAESPTFGATPAERFDAIVTEDGVLDGEGVREVAAGHRRRATWDDR